MACMPWYKVHAGWTTHEKVLTLCALLGDDRADVYVGRLWDYCAQRRGDGRFAGPAAAGLMEAAVRFTGTLGTLADAMVQAGLLERHDDGTLEVHDWAREQRAIAAKFEFDRKRPHSRARKANAQNHGNEPMSPSGHHRDIVGTRVEPPSGPDSGPPETPFWESRDKRVEKVQTPTESVGPAVARPPAAPVDMFPDAPTNPPRAKPDSPSAEWARWAVDTRQPVMPPDATAETSLKGHQWAVLGKALKTHGRLVLEAAFRLFLTDDYAREHAFPIGLFISQVERWVNAAKAEAARARSGGATAGAPAQPRRLVEM